jgi:HAD superfamily phosphatase (TIGR01668 family)
MDMLKRFFPQKYYKSVYDISIKQLHDKNIKGIIFDIDNTLAPFDIKYPDQNIKDFFIMLQKEGFKVSLVSNNKGNRVEVFNSQLNFPAVSRAGKPRLKGLIKAMKLMGTDRSTTAFVGDQLFTDVWAGNRMGVYSILVKPISERDEWSVKLKRGLEKMVLKVYFEKEGIK